MRKRRFYYILHKSKSPFLRDVYLAYLVRDARLTKNDGYPIIEEWMVATKPPREIIQWDRRRDVLNNLDTAISFYCNDYTFTPILNNPKKYVEKLKSYFAVIGLDASPYDNMPLWVQKSQIGLNIAITYYYGMKGIKIIPNIRLGSPETISSLEAYPRHTLISIGTNGFMKNKENRALFKTQIKLIVDTLDPTGICVYGLVLDEIFQYAKDRGINIYQFDSYTMKENAKDRILRLAV